MQTQPVDELETEQEPEETAEEYINPQGIKMRRITKRTIITRIVNINGKPERVEEPHEEVYEEPVADDDRPAGPAVDERIGVMRVQKRVELPDWEPVEITHRPRRYEPVEPVQDKPAKPVFGLRPTELPSEEIIKPSTVDRSYTLPEFDEEFTIMPDEQAAKPDGRPEEPSEPKESTVSVRMHDKENPLKFKITTVKKSRVGHVEAGPRKSNEYHDFDEPNKVGRLCYCKPFTLTFSRVFERTNIGLLLECYWSISQCCCRWMILWIKMAGQYVDSPQRKSQQERW